MSGRPKPHSEKGKPMTEPCWCCRPIGPPRPEPFERKTITEVIAEANELARLYYAVNPSETSVATPSEQAGDS
jgi:hypothetical protein